MREVSLTSGFFGTRATAAYSSGWVIVMGRWRWRSIGTAARNNSFFQRRRSTTITESDFRDHLKFPWLQNPVISQSSPICHSRIIGTSPAKAGELGAKPVPRTIFDRHLVIYRDEGGRPGICWIVARTRNMALSLGKVVDGCVWNALIMAGAMTLRAIVKPCQRLGPDGAIPSSIHVQSFQCIEQDGCVWVYCGEKDTAGRPFSFPISTIPAGPLFG